MFLEIIILICAIGIFVILARKLPNVIGPKTEEKRLKIEDKRGSLILLEEADRLFKKGDLAEAEKLYIQSASQDPRNPKIYNRLGAIYLEQKNFQDAKDAFQEAIRLDGKKASQYFNLSMAYLELKEYRNAIETLEKAVDLDKKNIKYRQALKAAKKELK